MDAVEAVVQDLVEQDEQQPVPPGDLEQGMSLVRPAPFNDPWTFGGGLMGPY